jgi:uncharacterized protein
MSKLLFFVLLAVAVYLLLRSARRGADDANAAGHGRRRRPEAMVACSYCGLHVPKDESIEVAGRTYCCAEHRRLESGNPDR